MVAVGIIILLLVSVNVSGDIDTKDVSNIVFDGKPINSYWAKDGILIFFLPVFEDEVFSRECFSSWHVQSEISSVGDDGIF